MDAELTQAATISPSAPARPSYAAEWRRAGVAILTVSVAVLLLFHGLVEHAVYVWWRSQTFNHCFLIVPLAAYMAWQRKPYAAQFRPTPDLRALLLLPVIGFGYVLVRFAGIIELQQHAVIAMLQVLFLVLLGWSAYRALMWPLLYLFFLVPSGEFLVPTLQDYTAWFSILALRVTGVPIYADGTFIAIPNGNFEVAETCAGVRFLIAALAFGMLYCDVMFRSAWRKLAFMALSIVVPIIANGFRAYGIVLLAYVTNNAAAIAADHIIFGWVFFSFIMVLLMLIGHAFREDDQPYGEPPPPASDAPPPALRTALAAVVAVALMAAAPAWARIVEVRAAPTRAEAFDLVRPTGRWQPVARHGEGWQPSYPQADATTHRAYGNGTRRAELFIAFFASQDSNKKLIGGDNYFDGRKRWRRISGATPTAEIADTGLLPIAERDAGPSGEQRLIWYLYWIDGSFVTSGMRVKLLQTSAELKGGGNGAALVAIATDIGEDVGAATATLDDFARSLGPLSSPLRQLAGRP
jgi:exosortase A